MKETLKNVERSWGLLFVQITNKFLIKFGSFTPQENEYEFTIFYDFFQDFFVCKLIINLYGRQETHISNQMKD